MGFGDWLKRGAHLQYLPVNYLARDNAGALREQSEEGLKQRGQDVNELIAMLRQQATGQGQSITGLQLRQALDQSRAQQQSMAAGARPGQQAAAMRMAMQNQSQLSTQMAGQAALARLQEQLAARQLLAQAIIGARGQDVQAAVGAAQIPTKFDKILGGTMNAGQLAAMGG